MCFSNVVGAVEEMGFYGHPITFLASFIHGQRNVSLYMYIYIYTHRNFIHKHKLL